MCVAVIKLYPNARQLLDVRCYKAGDLVDWRQDHVPFAPRESKPAWIAEGNDPDEFATFNNNFLLSMEGVNGTKLAGFMSPQFVLNGRGEEVPYTKSRINHFDLAALWPLLTQGKKDQIKIDRFIEVSSVQRDLVRQILKKRSDMSIVDAGI